MMKDRHFPLRLYISVLFAVMLLLIGGLFGVVNRQQLRQVLGADSAALTLEMSRAAAAEIRSMLTPAEAAIREIGFSRAVDASTLSDRLVNLGPMREALSAVPAIETVYIGYGNGDFFALRRLQNDAQRHALNTPPDTQFVIQSIERNTQNRDARYIYLDSGMRTLQEVMRPDYLASFDPRTRPWYRQAIASRAIVRTPPYAFFSTPEVGMTLALNTPGSRTVVACDINLDTLSNVLVAQRSTQGMVLALSDANGGLIASSRATPVVATSAGGEHRIVNLEEVGIPVLAKLNEVVRHPETQNRHTLMAQENGSWFVSVNPLDIPGLDPLYLVSAVPESEATHSATHAWAIGLIATLAIMSIALLACWYVAGLITRPLEKLDQHADAARGFESSLSGDAPSNVSEVRRLGTTLGEMTRTISRFLNAIKAMSSEPEFSRLLPALLTEILAEAHADAGVLYFADNGILKPASALTGNQIDVTERLPPLAIADGPTFIREAASYRHARNGVLAKADIGRGGWYPLQPENARHATAIPLLNRQRELVGIFLLLRPTPVESERLSFISTLAGLFVSALETRELIDAQQELFESFIRLIANAIDEKSRHTGQHCSRLPELVKMLARAACNATTGPYRDFQLDARQWRELHIAAWLHDCGKITTPECVIEKATKLETLYDRIHEIRMRFEVLKCHEEITYLKAVAAGTDPRTAKAHHDAALQALDDDFAFVAACNHGGEFMDEASIERLRQIGERTWIRTIDNRLGVARDELRRMEALPRASLPVAEKLLADKPEHRIERTEMNHAEQGNPWGFRMTVPELLYNRGELHNLSVPRGTLTAEERFKINEHIVQTIVMLSQLPFPRSMRNIPEIAGGHHEKMDGTGYPRGLKRDEISPSARMMAIADIFEALTATDRPYKRGKTLSESLRIMAQMKRNGHIGPDLFDLFVTSDAYREYAQRFMQPDQIDEVNVDDYLDRGPET